MKAFTFLEIVVVMMIIIILISISLNFTAFDRKMVYLKNFTYNLENDIFEIKEFALAQKFNFDSNVFFCGYGLIFEKENNSSSYKGYIGYAASVATSADRPYPICYELASSASATEIFTATSPTYYLNRNGQITNQPIETLVIKEEFKKVYDGDYLKISTSSQNCSQSLSYDYLNLIYYSPYGDLLLLGYDNSTNKFYNLLPSNWENLYLCLKYRDEELNFRINRSGQIIFY